MRKAAVAVMAAIIAGCGGGGSDSSSTDTAVSATPQADSPSTVATSPAPATSPTPATPSPASPSPPAASPTPTTAVPVPGPAPATEVRTITAQELIQALTHGVPQDAEYPVGAGNNPSTIAGWMLDHSRRAYPESGEPIVVSGGTWGNPVLHSDLTSGFAWTDPDYGMRGAVRRRVSVAVEHTGSSLSVTAVNDIFMTGASLTLPATITLDQALNTWSNGDQYTRLIPQSVDGRPDIFRLCWLSRLQDLGIVSSVTGAVLVPAGPDLFRLGCSEHRRSDGKDVGAYIVDDVGGRVTTYYGSW